MFIESASSVMHQSATIPVTLGPKLKTGTQLLSGFLPAGLIIPEKFRIPYRDFSKKVGYQRQPQQHRVNELAKDLRLNRVDLPTAVLLNIRDWLSQALKLTDKGWIIDLSVFQQKPLFFYVVDGQHRILALQKLIEESEGEDSAKWRSFALPFVCMLGANEAEEMNQFYVVNSKAKAVRTDLAFTLLKERADNDPEVLSALIERSKDWTVEGQAIAEKMVESSPVWKLKIRHAGMEKGDTVIPSASFVNSIKPLLQDSPFFKRSNQEQRIRILEAYWQGIRMSLREAFDDPDNFSLQKGIGVAVLHDILPDVLEIVRSSGESVLEPSSFDKVVGAALAQLQGENADGETVQGIDFWRTTSGAAGSFSSGAGKRVLVAKIRSLLPEIAAE